MARQPKSFKRVHIQLALDERNRKLPRPNPILDACPGRNSFELRWQLRACGGKNLARSGFYNFVHRSLPRRRPRELSRAKFARGNVQQRNRADRISPSFGSLSAPKLEIRREKIVLFLAQPGVKRRPRREHPRHLAPDDFLGKLGVLHLVAEGHAITLAQEAHQVVFHGVIRHAAHGLIPLAVARRQRQLQFPADRHSIVVEQLVEIAHAEEQQRIRILALGRRPLPHEWSQLCRCFVQGRTVRSRGLCFVFDHVCFRVTRQGGSGAAWTGKLNRLAYSVCILGAS